MLYQTQNPHGGDIYGNPVRLDFSANINPYGTPEGVKDAIREALDQVDRYPDPYCRTLRRAIADREGVPMDWVLCGNGAAELIYSFCQGVQPRRAAELAPTFSEYTLALEQQGGEMHRFFLDPEQGFLPGPELLDFLEAEKPQAVFLCQPNNPSGRLMPWELLEQVLFWCARNHSRLFLDACFLDLTGQERSWKEMLAQFPELLVLKAFTKSYGMAGVRLGWCLSSDAGLLEKMARCVQPWNVSTLAQRAGVAALKEQEFLEKTRLLIAAQRPRMERTLAELGLYVCPGEANYLLFRGWPGLDSALRERGIAIRSCANYFGLGPEWYRVAVRQEEENAVLLQELRQIREGR